MPLYLNPKLWIGVFCAMVLAISHYVAYDYGRKGVQVKTEKRQNKALVEHVENTQDAIERNIEISTETAEIRTEIKEVIRYVEQEPIADSCNAANQLTSMLDTISEEANKSLYSD